MKNLLKFLLEAGKLGKIKRKGITFYGIKNPDSATDHSFRMALMIWLLSKKGEIDIKKAFKMILIHDICKIYTGDITPYDGLLPKNKKERDEFVRSWRRLPLYKKERAYSKKFKKEYIAIKKLVAQLPEKLKKEIFNLWLEYHGGETMMAKFVYQIDMLENLLEAFEHYKRDKNFPTRPWWQHAEEVIDDPVLLEFLQEIEKEELKK